MGFRFDSGHHSELTVVGVVVMKAIGVHAEMDVDTVRLVDLEGAFIVGDMEFFTDILKRKNVGDGFGVKPNVAVVGYMCLHFGG